MVGVEHEQRERVGESDLVAVEHLERASAAEKHAREAQLDLELEAAFLDDASWSTRRAGG